MTVILLKFGLIVVLRHNTGSKGLTKNLGSVKNTKRKRKSKRQSLVIIEI